MGPAREEWATWRGAGTWQDSGGHSAEILAPPPGWEAGEPGVAVIENSNGAWSGRGFIDGASLEVLFANGLTLRAELSADGETLEWSNGAVWSRPHLPGSELAVDCCSSPMDAKSQEPQTEVPGETDQEQEASSADLMQSLSKEVRLLHSYLDLALAVALLLGAAAFQSTLLLLALPAVLSAAVFAGVVGLLTGTSTVYFLGSVDISTCMLLLLNIFVIAPYNVAMFLLFYPTWPLRMLLYQRFQCWAIPTITFGKVKVPFADATFLAMLRVLPMAYDNILPRDPAFKPFHNIDEASQEQAGQAIAHSAFIAFLRKFCGDRLPTGLLNALALRLCFFMFMIPTLGWWLVGPCYIPLLPVRFPQRKPCAEEDGGRHGPDSEQAGQPSEEPCGTGGAGGPCGAARRKRLRPACPEGASSSMPSASLAIPECRFLKVARAEWGEDVGRQKCLNE